MYYIYDEDIRGGLEAINKAVKDILTQTSSIINDEDLLFDLRLVLNELLINAYTHGNQGNQEKLLKLRLIVDDIELKLRIKDQGTGIKRSMYNCDNLLDHGRGLHLVENLVDAFEIDQNIVRCLVARR